MATIRLAALGDSLTSGGGFCGVQTPWPQLLTQTGGALALPDELGSAEKVLQRLACTPRRVVNRDGLLVEANAGCGSGRRRGGGVCGHGDGGT